MDLHIYYTNGTHTITGEDVTAFIKADTEERAVYIFEKELSTRLIVCIHTNPEKLDDSLLELPDHMGYIIPKYCKGSRSTNDFIRVYTREEKIDTLLD